MDDTIPDDYQYLITDLHDERLVKGFGRVFRYIFDSKKIFITYTESSLYSIKSIYEVRFIF